MDDITTRSDYLTHFSGSSLNNGKQAEALKQALDIRKFEIDLYWKRTTYFWTIIAAIFAGFFVLQKSGPSSASADFWPTYIVSNLGFVFSLGWYFVNRGSKAWQRNWEAHVDLLEDEVMGPLYKTGINRYMYKFFDLTEAYPFSVSRINQILSLFVAATWLFLVIHSIASMNWNADSDRITFGVMSSFTLLAVYLFFKKGRTSKTDAEIQVALRQRKYVDMPHSEPNKANSSDAKSRAAD
jgi:hypothetical protein